MIELIAKYITILFGLFFIFIGFLMLFRPKKVRAFLRMAGSTNLINYGEITIRMLPATALIIYGEFSKFPEVLIVFGWFMLITSFVLFLYQNSFIIIFQIKLLTY